MVCPFCKSDNIETDHGKGITFCVDCDGVIEENIITNEVGFENQQVVGTFVTNDFGKFFNFTFRFNVKK